MIGRTEELERLGTLVEAARRGRGAALRVTGEPGIGKTTLLAELHRVGRDLRVIDVIGVETESELPYAALDAALRPIIAQAASIPEAQGRALRVALALEEGDVEPLAVGAGTLSLLAEASDEAPIVVIIDDAQWLDDASANALAFAARRLTEESVAVVVASRDESETPFDPLPAIKLVPLEDADARAVVLTRSQPVAAADTETILDAAGGNPLALLELSVTAARLLPRSATVADRLSRAFSSRLSDLPAETRCILLLAALEPSFDVVLRAATTLGLGQDALAAAETLRLVRLEGHDVVFRHPVVRSVIYSHATDAEQHSARAALAEALTGPADADRRAWHLAGSAGPTDDRIAALLEETAEHAAARGGQRAAARALERSAELSTSNAERARRLYLASRLAFWSGDPKRALAFADEGLRLTGDPLLHADLVVQSASIVEWQGEGSPEATIRKELEVPGLDDERRSKLLMEAVKLRLDALDADAAVALAPQLETHARGASEWWRERGLATAAASYLAAGRSDEAARLFGELLPSPAVVANFAFDYLALEWFDELRSALTATLQEGRASGHLLRVAWNQGCGAHLDLRLGRLAAAETAASEAIPLADTNGTMTVAGFASAALAHVYAWRGRSDACVATARIALDAAQHGGDMLQQQIARHALALLALGEGRADDAAAELEPAARLWRDSSVVEPNQAQFVPDYVEALSLSGELDEAYAWLERYREIASAAGRVGPLAAVDRVTGVITKDDFEPHFEAALAKLERAPFALDRARTRLNLGERLRRAGRRRDARLQLRAAYDAFAAADASLWVDRATAELRALGDAVQQREDDLPNLTPQERHIASLVAEGKTNKEIAAAMYVSPKTVNYHLTNTFRKLGIHSRAALARLVADQTI